jgi:hypothetical protein
VGYFKINNNPSPPPHNLNFLIHHSPSSCLSMLTYAVDKAPFNKSWQIPVYISKWFFSFVQVYGFNKLSLIICKIDSYSAGPEIFLLPWYPNVKPCHHTNMTQKLIRIRFHWIPISTIHTTKANFNIIPHFCLYLPRAHIPLVYRVITNDVSDYIKQLTELCTVTC